MLKKTAIKACDMIIQYGLLAIIFFVPLIIDFTGLTYNIVDIYKAVFFRLILSLALLAYAAKVLLTGKLSCRGGGKIYLPVFLLLLSFFLSSLFSIHPNQSFWGDFFRQQGFYSFLHYLVFFILLILNIGDFKFLGRMVAAAVLSASFTAVYGLMQYLNLDAFSWSEGAWELGRIFSTLGQPNWYGHFLILVLPFGLYALFFMAKGFYARFFIGLSVLAQLLCLVFTYSRAAWLGFLGEIIFLAVVWLLYKRHNISALGLIGLVLVGVAAVIGANIINPSDQYRPRALDFISRARSLVDFNGAANKMRLYLWRAGLEEIRRAEPRRLLFGYGPETLAGVYIKHYQPDWAVYEAINALPDRAHNWPLDRILAFGFFGLFAILVFYFYFIYRVAAFLLSKRKFEPADWLLIFLLSGLAANAINNLFSFSLLTNTVFLYLILAIGWFIISRQEPEKTIDFSLTAFFKILIWVLLLAVLAVFISAKNINQIKAEIYFIKALKSMQAPDCPGALNNFERVLSLSPDSNYYQEKYLALALDCFSAAKDNRDRTSLGGNILYNINRFGDKGFYHTLINLGRCYTEFGFYFDQSYYVKAEKIFNKLIIDYPNIVTAYEDLGKEKVRREDYAGAIEVFEKAVKILPPLDHPDLYLQHRQQIVAVAVRLYENLGQAQVKAGNYDLGFEYYKKGLSLDPYRATLYKDMADIYYLRGRLDEAIGLNRRGATLFPKDYHWPLSLSLLYREKKDLVRAKEYLEQALKLAPENEELKNYYQELNKR